MSTSGSTGTTSKTTYVSSRKFDTASIGKLSGTNFRVWKMRMTSLFTTHGIMSSVDGTQPRPAITGTDRDSGDQGNNEAFTSMLMTMTDEEVEGISGCKTASEIWTKLNTMYQSLSGELKQILSQRYYGVMACDYRSPVKTMLEIQNLAAQLRSMGVTQTDDAEVVRVITSLIEEKYRQFREA